MLDPRFLGLRFDCEPLDFFGTWWCGGFPVHDVLIMFEAKRNGSSDFVIGCHAEKEVKEDLRGLFGAMNVYKQGNCDKYWYWRINFPIDGFRDWLDINLLTRFLNGDEETINKLLDEFGEIVKIAVPFIERIRAPAAV
ncbi:MAG: hypothetical protein IPL99_08255 [Candidatus Competibacteraceae bacterium]|nr:hypothetical protein [Candidatus Competibacteraceae bacterium]